MTMNLTLVIVGCVFSALLTFAIFYLRDIRDSVKSQINRHDKLRKELSELKESLPKEYVRREDWIMSFGKIDQKIDAIWEFINQHIKKWGK